MRELRAGWAKREITPAPGYAMGGYIARSAPAVGAFDPLYIRVLLLEQGTTRLLMVLADVLLISSRWAEHLRREIARALGTRPAFIIIAATHTHSGPILDTHPFNFSGDVSEPHLRQYSEKLEQAMIETSLTASSRLCSVSASFARVEIAGVATDRNSPQRARRQSLFLFKFEAVKDIALLAVYGCHPTVLGPDNHALSGDLHGSLSTIWEGKAAIALVANGAAANISTRFIRKEQTPKELKRLANKITRQAATARFQPITLSPFKAQLRTAVLPLGDLSMAVRLEHPRSGRKAAVAEEAIHVRAHISRAAEFMRPTLALSITEWRWGPIRLAALPLEIYSETGMFLWRHAHTIPVCYANGYWGYLTAASAARNDYEALSSPFSRAADAILRRSLCCRETR